MRKTIAAALVAAVLIPATAVGQAVCGDRAEFLEHLGRTHQEQPRAMGILSNGNLLEVLVGARGSWTVLVTTADGATCAVASGEAWQFIEPVAPPPAEQGS